MPGGASISVVYLDGRSARGQAAALTVSGEQLQVSLAGSAEFLSFDLRAVRWSERTAQGARSADLPGGARLQAADAQAWDAFVKTHVRHDSWVVRAQQSWRGAATALVLLLTLCSGLYVWGLPALAGVVTPMIPKVVDETLGQNALAQLDGRLFEPSTLPPETQDRLRERVSRVLSKSPVAGFARLEFRKSKIGPNALALPGGTVIVTDELVRLVQDEDTVLGVIGHELGHVSHRHGMRQLVQVTALQAGLSLAMGDYGSFLTAAPLALAAMSYSRAHERQADQAAVVFMRQAGISPVVMVRFFEQVAKRRGQAKPERAPGISIIASHPDDAERIAFFRAAAQQP